MSDEPTLASARRCIEGDMRLIVSGGESRYDAGWRIWATAMEHASASKELMWPLWLLWGALTDWVEVRPAEADRAESAMQRAAQEWLSLPDNAEAQRAYFDRWLYDEIGYERPEQSNQAR
jgi:hypothetical protein